MSDMEKAIRRKGTIKGSSALVLTAFIWGFGFVVMRSGMDYVGPFIFNGFRFALGCLTLIPFLALQTFRNKRLGAEASEDAPRPDRLYIRGGLFSGLILFLGMSFSQAGLVFTPASKAGFLTAMYIVLTPIVGVFLKKKTHWNTWLSVLIGGTGLYFLSITGKLTFAPGDGIVLIGSIFWSVHVFVIDYYVNRTDVLRFNIVQFATCALLSLIASPFLDGVFAHGADLSGLIKAIPNLLFVGIASSGLAFSLQGFGQKHVPPTAAALIMSFEAVFGMLGGVLLLGETLSTRELFGCFLMFCAVILAQLPVKSRHGDGPPV